MTSPTLDTAYGRFIDLLHATKRRYLVIGALAVGMLGEARLTHDLDFLLFLTPEGLPVFLKHARRQGFSGDPAEAQRRLQETGTFRLSYHGIPIDCLTASTALEEQMWRRAKRLRLHRRLARFPSAEDLILLKLLPGRPKDLLDAQGILLRHRGRLDMAYLRNTAQQTADELQDAGIWHRLERLLKEM